MLLPSLPHLHTRHQFMPLVMHLDWHGTALLVLPLYHLFIPSGISFWMLVWNFVCPFLFKYFCEMYKDQIIDRMFSPSLMFGESCSYRIHLIPGLQVDPRWSTTPEFISLHSCTHVTESDGLSYLPLGFSTRSKHDVWHLINYRRIWLSKFRLENYLLLSGPIGLLSADSDMSIHFCKLFLNAMKLKVRVILWPMFLIYPYLSTSWLRWWRHLADHRLIHKSL